MDRPPADWWATATAAAPPGIARLLDAFGGPRPSPPGSLAALAGWVALAAPQLPVHVRAVLTGEVDAAQAAMFARRFAAVDRLLVDLDAPTAPILRAGLVCRTAEILHGPGPRALRVRAVADFYYSQGARVLHALTHEPRSITALVADATWREVADGVAHATLSGTGPAGPVHANVLKVTGRRLRARDLRGGDGLIAAAADVAATSGGFFLYSEPDIAPPNHRTDPVGLLVADGCVVGAPWFRRAALIQHADGHLAIRRIGPEGSTVHVGDRRWTIGARNDPSAVGRVPVLFTRAWGEVAPVDGLRLAGGAALGRGRAIPLLGGVLCARDADGTGPTRWTLADPTIRDAMAGGPALFGLPRARTLAVEDFAGSAPPVTFSRDETFDQNLLPRMAAGLAGQTLVLAAIDGRDLHRAPGFTLGMTAALLEALGCTVATNLDGGSSKRMVVGRRQVDLATTEVVTTAGDHPVRPVHSALIVGERLPGV